MTLEDKKELVRLLHLYMVDIWTLLCDTSVYDKLSIGQRAGIESQYDHTWIITNELEGEISTALFTNG